jgi:para-nitrobenzyl esterase
MACCQQAALQWVKANIAAFGEDAERITIFGQSAGAMDVGHAMASPLPKRLFRLAIIKSSVMFGTTSHTPKLRLRRTARSS